MSSVGDRLGDERKRLGLSQADAALLVGVSRKTWGEYERGQAPPRAETLVALIGHGLDVNYVLGGARAPEASALTDAETYVLGCYRDVDDEGRAAIERTCKLESMRCSDPRNPYTPQPQTTRLAVHEPAVKKPAKPSPR